MWKIVEFLNICGEEYPNQEITYDNNGKLKKEYSNFFKYNIKKANIELYYLTIYYTPATKKHVINTINFSEETEVDKNFCKIDSAKKISLRDFNSEFRICLNLSKKKHRNFRGYIEENLFEENSKKEVINHQTKRTYFDILVKDSTKTVKN